MFSNLYIVLDVVSIEKTGEFFRLIYDVKGRFAIHRISAEEAKVSSFKLFMKLKLIVFCCVV